VASVSALLASGSAVEIPMQAGEDTGEWAYDRPDVRDRVRHERPRVFESWPGLGGGFEGHRYLSTLRLPGRYLVNAIRVEALPGPARLCISRAALFDAHSGSLTGVSAVAGFLSDADVFHIRLGTPALRLFRLANPLGRAYVVERLRRLPSDADVLHGLAAPRTLGLNLRREALAVEDDVRQIELPSGLKASRARVERAEGSRIDLRAEGPGILVVAEGWNPGWRVDVDGRRATLFRVNHAQMGCVLGSGVHRASLRYYARGLRLGCVMAVLGLALLVWPVFQRRVSCHGFDRRQAGVLGSASRRFRIARESRAEESHSC
jgi:hypothetical protein